MWGTIESMLCGQEGRIRTMLDPQFSYTQMRQRKIFVISDGHAGTFDPHPQPGERIYTSVTNHMSRCEQYTDMVDLGDVVLDFSAIAQKIREIRLGINKQDEMYVGTVHIFWSMLDRDGEPIQPGDVLDRSWSDLISELQNLDLRVYVTMNFGAAHLVGDSEGSRKFAQTALCMARQMEKLPLSTRA